MQRIVWRGVFSKIWKYNGISENNNKQKKKANISVINAIFQHFFPISYPISPY